jgi:hypothetical protein
MHPIKTATDMYHQTADNIKQGVEDYGQSGLSETTRRDFGRAVPIFGPTLAKAQEQHDAGNDLGMAGTLTGFVGGMAAPEALAKGIARIPSATRSVLAGDVTKPMAGTNISPLERYQAAKRVGVNLPPAQATNSPILKPLDWINREGLLSAPLHESLAAKNTAALTGATDELLGRMSPFDPETGGKVIQDRLKSPFVDLQNEAHETLEGMSPLGREQGGTRLQSLLKGNQEKLETTGGEQEQAIRDSYGELPIGSYDPMRSTARTILQQNAPVDELVPGLAQNHTRKILQSIGRFGEEPAEGATAPVRPNVGNALDLRTRLLDLKGNNPELVRGAADADLDRMIGATHQTIADTLPPEGQHDWLKANEIWKDMKDTYDNPSSPFYHAVRTPSPSTLVEGIGGTSPESVRALRTRSGPEGVGIVGRGVGEKLFGKNAEGEYDLKNFGSRLERMPEDSRNELFGANRHEQMQGIGARYRELQPFEDAAYTKNPESLVQGVGLGPETAAGVRMLRDVPVKPEGAEGPPAPRIGQQGMGAVQRGVAEKLLGRTAETGYNFPTFAGKLARMNEGYRSELFGPHEGTLNDVATTARALDTNFNRSGSGKLTQKALELTALLNAPHHPWAAIEPLVQYPLGKFMTSPKVADWLMRPQAAPNPFFSPGVGATAGAAVAPKRRTSPFER